MISVVIPAHNEEQVITRCLTALTHGAASDELRVVVVCNGCTDRTAEVAREFGNVVQVIETDVASKSNALNLGDAAAVGFPRFYVDADVVIEISALRELATELVSGRVLAAAPRVQFETRGAPWSVRAFYRIADILPSASEGIGGSGVYGLSQQGRERFQQFPSLTADDGFVRVQFRQDERRTYESCRSTVFAPQTFSELLGITTRAHFGTSELRRRLPENWENKGPSNHVSLLKLLSRPWLWVDLVVYVWVKLVARKRARERFQNQQFTAWERDNTSRADSIVAKP